MSEKDKAINQRISAFISRKARQFPEIRLREQGGLNRYRLRAPTSQLS